MSYHTLVGTRAGKSPAEDYFEMPNEERPDDGLLVPLGYEPWPSANCPDCAQKGREHPLVWAEAGFVPGHRVCLWCGSHFELTTDRALYMEEHLHAPREDTASLWVLRRARFYRRRG